MNWYDYITAEEFGKTVSAALVGGIRKDAKYNAFEILADNDEDELLDKYYSLPKKEQKEFRKSIRKAVRDYRDGNLGHFSDYI